MIEMMFAAALSGMRTSAEAEVSAGIVSAHSKSEQSPEIGTAERSGEWHPDASFEDEEECPIFFEKEIEGLGSLRIGPRCARDGLPYAL